MLDRRLCLKKTDSLVFLQISFQGLSHSIGFFRTRLGSIDQVVLFLRVDAICSFFTGYYSLLAILLRVAGRLQFAR